MIKNATCHVTPTLAKRIRSPLRRSILMPRMVIVWQSAPADGKARQSWLPRVPCKRIECPPRCCATGTDAFHDIGIFLHLATSDFPISAILEVARWAFPTARTSGFARYSSKALTSSVSGRRPPPRGEASTLLGDLRWRGSLETPLLSRAEYHHPLGLMLPALSRSAKSLPCAYCARS